MALVARVLETRQRTLRLAAPLEIEDWVVQSMPDASPVKWHLAHTTWFFERFVLHPLGIKPVVDGYEYLFNSYYDSVGERHPRSRRGMLSRPTSREIIQYRKIVDARIAELERSPRFDEIAPALELGRNHEQQHQELILTDVKHMLAQNPLLPAYRTEESGPSSGERHAMVWRHFDGGIRSIGDDATAFAFDNERPHHRVYVEPFGLASRLVTTGEYEAFIADRGYERPELWLSEGWAWVEQGHKKAPLYWTDDGAIFTLDGKRPRHADEPVCHVTYYEADAFARWSGARLPREAEWEIAARHAETPGTFVEDGTLHPRPAAPGSALGQVLGDVWEWTASAYLPYPGFVPLAGAFGEYNGKFMVNQMVLRGGSCATPRDHIRATYRNFFPAGAAWQFSGIRLARDEA